MPSSYEILDLEGMNIDTVRRRFPVLRGRFGEGYSAGRLNGSAAGTHAWTLSSGCLPDNTIYGTINSLSRFEYYWDFFQRMVSNGDRVFIISFRGKYYHASFAERSISAEVFTADLFAAGVPIRQRRVRGFEYDEDGGFTLTGVVFETIPVGFESSVVYL